MSRSPSSGIVTALTADGSYPGFLIRMVVAGQTFRLCTLDVGFTFGGFSWISSDVDVSDVKWDSSGVSPGVMRLGDADLVWWAFTLNLQMQDAPIDVWQIYASAPNEAEPLWSGRIGRIVRNGLVLECALTTDLTRMNSPRRRVQNIVPAKYLLMPGRTLNMGGAQWVLERKGD